MALELDVVNRIFTTLPLVQRLLEDRVQNRSFSETVCIIGPRYRGSSSARVQGALLTLRSPAGGELTALTAFPGTRVPTDFCPSHLPYSCLVVAAAPSDEEPIDSARTTLIASMALHKCSLNPGPDRPSAKYLHSTNIFA